MKTINLVIKLMDGRVGLGYRYKRHNQTFYFVSGHGFCLDSVAEQEIFEYATFAEIFTQ